MDLKHETMRKTLCLQCLSMSGWFCWIWGKRKVKTGIFLKKVIDIKVASYYRMHLR